jgi:TolB-like protein/cytochrome c-type biogenesis protein CcmH/NrfG
MAEALIRFGPFLFDRQRMTLARDGHAIGIGSRGAALFGALLEAGGGVVGKDALIAAAWPDSVVEERNLTVQIAALRKAMGETHDGQDWIATVPRVGYRLVGNDEAPHATRPSIAVLPFTNLSGDLAQEHVADGLVEELITALSRFHTFAVVARNSSFVYKGRNVDAREVAKTLGVRYLLEGSVRRSGDKVRVTAQLIEGATGEHLWAEKFDGSIADIFDFQDSIATSVIGLIEPQIRKAEIERARRKRPENLDAWDLFIQALPLVQSSDVEGYSQAVELLTRAVAIDPGYAPAVALLAWAHEKRYTFGVPALPDYESDKELCVALIERAVQIDPDDALSLVQLGWFRILFRADYTGIDQVRRAVALNPNNISVLDFAAVAHQYAGDPEEAIACATRALQLSPGAPNNFAIITHISSAYLWTGRFSAAAEAAQRAVDLAPKYIFGHLHLAVSRALLGETDAARREMETALKLRPDMTIATVSTPSRFAERRNIWVDGLREAGMPEG